jgi:hypothetical protein
MSDIITIEGVSKTRRAWLTDLSLDTQINYMEANPTWRAEHNRTDVLQIDDPPTGTRTREKLRKGGGRKRRKGENKPRKPPKSRKKEGEGTVEYGGAVWKWDYQRKDWMMAEFTGKLKGKTGRKKKEPTKEGSKKKSKPKIKTESRSQDQATITAYQISTVVPSWRSRYSINNLVKIDDQTLRLASKPRGRNQVNMDIRYNRGTDLYDIKAYEITKDMSVYEVYDDTGFYTDNLPAVLDKVLYKRDFKRGKLVQEGFKI